MKVSRTLPPFILVLLLSACSSTSTPTATPAPTEAPLDEQIATWQAEVTPLPSSTSAPSATPLPTDAPTPTATPLPSPDDWQSAPIVPGPLSERAKEIYLNGLALGNDPHAFAKVGDCGGTPSWFLGSFDLGAEFYSLGDYAYLSGVIGHYTGSFERYSQAVSPGFNTASVFSPLWADPAVCQAGEGPLQCELRIQNPSVVLIMLGTNDQFHPDEFEAPLREIIEYTIEQGGLPILASKPDNLEGDGAINLTIYKLALEYELPFWNLWAAVQGLPNNGLQEDNAHMTWAPNFFDDSYAMQAGWPHRNLTALQALDAVWQQLPTP